MRNTLANLAAMGFALAWAVPILWPETGGPWSEITIWVTWIFLAVDVVMDWYESESTWAYLKSHWLEVLAVGLPLLRPLRLVRLFLLIRKIDQSALSNLTGSVGVYLTSTAGLIGAIASVAILGAERGAPGSTIHGFGDAMWWTITTMTTVGYGDTHPVTQSGRLIAMALMVCGIALLGGVAATVASLLTSRVVETEDHIEAKVDRLTAAVAELNTKPSPARTVATSSAKRAVLANLNQ